MSRGTLNIHACLVGVGAAGILVTGPARSGKSSLLVSLLRGAAREGLSAALVADDRVVIERQGTALVGSAPAPLAGLLELSGIGLLRIVHDAQAPVTLVAELGDAGERLPEPSQATFLGVRVPRLVLPARQAPFAADLLLTVLAAGPQALVET